METCKKRIKYEVLGDTSILNGFGVLITTSSRVLYMDFPDGIFTVADKHPSYGLTRAEDGTFWFAQRDKSVIKRFRLIDGEFEGLEQTLDLRTIINSQAARYGLHAIDFIDDELYILDTYNNRCLIGLYAEELGEVRIIQVIYPRGMHSDVGSYDKNGYHAHFNTIYSTGDYVYMMAHNNTIKTKVLSELYMFDKDRMRLVGVVQDIGSSCHDLVVDATGDMHMCDSGNSEVKVFDGSKFNTVWDDKRNKSFTRGLAMNDDINIIGGSFRADGLGYKVIDSLLFITDKNFIDKCVIKVCGIGQVHQIRFTELDYGYSNTWRKHGD
jgi:hypothetical protein